jgi:hypothetical protein
MFQYHSIFLSISTHFSHIPPFHTEYIDMAKKTVLFQGDLGRVPASWLELIVVAHAHERGVQRQVRHLLGGALPQGGHPRRWADQ